MRPYAEVEKIFRINTLYTAFIATFDSNYFFPGERHNFYEIVIVKDGVLGVTAGSDVYVLTKGQAIIHEPMEFHALWSEGGTSPTVIVITFSASNIPCYSSKIFDSCDSLRAKEILDRLKKNFDIPINSFIGIKNENSTDYQIAVKELEIFLLSTLPKAGHKAQVLSSQSAKNYAKIVKILENNIDKRLSVSDIARLANMSEINLKKTFSKYAGTGVIAYFTELKINAAITLIRGGASVKECAMSLGFDNQNYFSATFKRVTGKRPSEYKP